MNGAESLIASAAVAGVEVCFANPGTTELSLVTAFDSQKGIRPILALFEGVVTGAADGYGRMKEKPALTLTHLGPSFANGVANLHNAMRARSPIVNIIGDHPAWHRELDPPLASDVLGIAKPVSHWLRRSKHARNVAVDIAEAIGAAQAWPGQIATLIVPADCQWEDAGATTGAPRRSAPPSLSGRAVRRAGIALRGAGSMLLVGGRGLRARGMAAAQRIAAATGCQLFAETFPARFDRQPDSMAIDRFPYLTERARALLESRSCLVLAGASTPVPYFAARDEGRSIVPSKLRVMTLATPEEDVVAALEALQTELTTTSATSTAPVSRPTPTGWNARMVLSRVAASQPDNAIIVDEGVSYGGLFLDVPAPRSPHSYLALSGGATGYGIPCSVGAAIACPDRKVIAIIGDGSACYTLQGLWTQARENLDVVTLVLANRGYQILRLELERKLPSLGASAAALTTVERPDLDWLALAKGFGVPVTSVDTVESLDRALSVAFSERGPRVIVVQL